MGNGSNCGEGIVHGDEEMDLWLDTREGGSTEVALEASEKAGEVSGASMGRLIEGSVYMGGGAGAEGAKFRRVQLLVDTTYSAHGRVLK